MSILCEALGAYVFFALKQIELHFIYERCFTQILIIILNINIIIVLYLLVVSHSSNAIFHNTYWTVSQYILTSKADEGMLLWVVLTLQSRCSRLWSEAHFLWSSESSSTWLSRLKCSRASFSCISRTCSSCSKEHTLPRYQMD